MDNVVPDVKPVVHDTKLSAKNNFLLPSVEFSKRSKNASSNPIARVSGLTTWNRGNFWGTHIAYA